MDLFRSYGNLLKLDGTNQLQRTLPALEKGYIVPDERSLSDLIEYARQVAAEIRFYNLSGQATGDWRPLLEPLVDVATGRTRSTDELETALNTRRDWPPHVALFLVFLKLLRHLQDDLNELPTRHLRHYYETELNLLRRHAVADDVHVIFELARNAIPTKLSVDTVLDAGKDSKGRSLSYATQSELVVSSAKVSDIRRLIAETDRRGQRRFFIADTISEDEASSWYTFGRKQLDLDISQRFMQEAELGFAIASPMLSMAEGERTLKITAYLSTTKSDFPTARRISNALNVALTGAEGWLTPNNFNAEFVDYGPANPMTLEITLTLNEAEPAIVAFDSTLHGKGPASDWPVVCCVLKGESGQYDMLEGLVVASAELSVTVKGVKDLRVQNDQGPLTPDQPMPLFGTQPRNGSHFYIGSAEVFSKKLSSLTLNLEWQDLPENLFSHYEAYFDTVDDNLEDNFSNEFLFDADLLYARSWDHSLFIHQTMFGYPDPAQQSIVAGTIAFNTAFGNRSYQAQPDLDKLGPYDAKSKYGFIRLILDGPSISGTYTPDIPFKAFGHQAFSRRYAKQAIALSRWDGSTGSEPQLPNEPYTPTLANLSLDYTATATLNPGDKHAHETLFILEPFGYTEVRDDITAGLVPKIEGTASLYIGIEKLQPPANLSLLFQMDSGTATSAAVLQSGETHWSYLSDGLWQSLPPEAVLNDSTYGFQQPGLVVLSVGKEASTKHTTMPTDLVWLRALIQKPPGSASRTLSLHAQAGLARFDPDTGSLTDYEEHLQNRLAADKIQRLKKRNAAIKQVSQPYTSFAGRSAEQDDAFFRRSSERLRHRNRAVTVWDFERLVLEAFPEVFKVKCLPHSNADGTKKAGEAALVILPDLRNTESTNPLEPRAGAVLMGRIEDYVGTDLCTPFATINVIHPVYEHILVDARVAFYSGLDAGYYAGVLNEDLRRFLSPWAFEEGRDILFGARIYKSEILAFMEGRNYVDYITDFNLYHSYEGPPRGGIGNMQIGTDFMIRPDPSPAIAGTSIGIDTGMVIGEDFVVGRGVEVAETTQPHAILVSHDQHRISPVTIGEDHCSGVDQLGIGYMTVGLDFDVQAEYF